VGSPAPLFGPPQGVSWVSLVSATACRQSGCIAGPTTSRKSFGGRVSKREKLLSEAQRLVFRQMSGTRDAIMAAGA